MKEVVIAKLVTGEFVVGSYYADDKEFLEDVYTLMLMPQQGVMQMSLIPYMMPFEQDGCTLDVKHIIKEIPAHEDVLNAYTQELSGIIIPKSKIQM